MMDEYGMEHLSDGEVTTLIGDSPQNKGQYEGQKDGMLYALDYDCPECDQKTLTEDSIEKHIRFHGIIKHYCKECDFEGTSKNNLHEHKKSIHRLMKYGCSFCDFEANLYYMYITATY